MFRDAVGFVEALESSGEGLEGALGGLATLWGGFEVQIVVFMLLGHFKRLMHKSLNTLGSPHCLAQPP